jgi:thermitase
MFILKLLIAQLSLVFAITDHPAVPNEYLVKMKPQFKGLSAKEVRKTLHVKGSIKLGLENWYKVKTVKSITKLSQNPSIEIVEPNYYQFAVMSPNDNNYKYQWGMKNNGQQDNDGNKGVEGVDIDVESVWDVSTGSKDVVVAVIDTGIDHTHKDLNENMYINMKEANGEDGVDDDGNGYVDDVSGYNFFADSPNAKDDHGHGTHCAGVIGAKGNNDYGMAGINWNVSLMPVKFLSKDGRGSTDGAVSSIIYAVDNGAKILSNSWGGGGESQALKDAIDYAASKNVLFVAAAGNNGEDTDSEPHFPSSYDNANIISVAAMNNGGDLADFSNYGLNTVDVAAPGVNILSTLPGNVFEDWSGTSMATPFVSGVAALMLSVNPSLNALVIKEKILTSVKPMDSVRGKVLTGGLLNARQAVSLAY